MNDSNYIISLKTRSRMSCTFRGVEESRGGYSRNLGSHILAYWSKEMLQYIALVVNN